MVTTLWHSPPLIEVLVSFCRVYYQVLVGRERASRVQVFVMHLNIADLIVTFVMLPIEIGK